MVGWSLAVSDQAKQGLRGRAGTTMPKVLNRQEFISHFLESPSPNTCDLQTKNLLPRGTEQPDDSLQASFSVMRERSTAAIFLWQISLPTTSFISLS